jgi:YVTN family beta-propeller protein
MNKQNSFIAVLILFYVALQSVAFCGDNPKEEKVNKRLNHLKTITGRISPKSIVHNKKGLFFAQNMMYRHTITVYNRDFKLVKTISDEVKLSDYGIADYKGSYKGAPVECAFSHNGKFAWVSNYEMKGGTSEEFKKPGCDGCVGKKYDQSYVYRINTKTFKIDNVIEVGAVPKFIATTPNNRYVLVTNWTSGDLSIIDTETNKEIKRIDLGSLPRGIDINSTSTFAYVAIMGSDKIAEVNLESYEISWIKDVGRGPRHICISPDDKFLYVTINNESKVAKINLTDKTLTYVKTGNQPRSMVISKDGNFLYVVNYNSNTLYKIQTSNMEIIYKVNTSSKPIGVTFDDKKNNIWVACYTGKIMIFHDTYYDLDEPLVYATQEEEDVLTFLGHGFLNETKPDKTLASIAEEYAPKEKGEKSKEIEEEKENSKEESVNPKDQENLDGFLVISGSYSKESNAEKKVNYFNEKGYKAGMYYSEDKSVYRVYVLNTNTKQEAIEFQGTIEDRSWIFTLK